eukprot:1520815-Prymnesium_polylepis.3
MGSTEVIASSASGASTPASTTSLPVVVCERACPGRQVLLSSGAKVLPSSGAKVLPSSGAKVLPSSGARHSIFLHLGRALHGGKVAVDDSQHVTVTHGAQDVQKVGGQNRVESFEQPHHAVRVGEMTLGVFGLLRGDGWPMADVVAKGGIGRLR